MSGVYLTLDWIRTVGPDAIRAAVREFLVARFGEPEAKDQGLYVCKKSETYPGGVRLLWEHPSDICIVDASGSALAKMTAEDRVAFLRDLLRFGMHTTRVDCAGDFVDQGLNLYEQAKRSCEAEELCGAKTYEPWEKRSRQEWKGRTLYLGKRGKEGSGRCVRLYDKGLQTQTGEVGEWERWEVEFTGDPARMAGRMIAEAADWSETHKSLMLGAVEFRVNKGDMHKSRRPLVEWWAAMVRAVQTVRHAAERPVVEFNRWKKWAQKCVIPTITGICAKLEVSTDELLMILSDTRREPKKLEIGNVVDLATRWWAEMGLAVPDSLSHLPGSKRLA